MTGFGHGLRVIGRQVHLLKQREGPSEVLRGKIAELEKFRKRKKSMKKDQFIVDVPESNSFLDTPSMPMILTAVGIALFAKLLMMFDRGLIFLDSWSLIVCIQILKIRVAASMGGYSLSHFEALELSTLDPSFNSLTKCFHGKSFFLL
ncbi:uncharacterized protein LOC103502279 isoform X3 [Cucumis melo]|uniref:Uncharacterized protein LOC103502279 isoform X3 n=1 Tax=Cucumis melo TaxID=3656 RepID=A0A1S3CLB5_CUCME|nr:uncharacterized protein LOC103502279 isoform X3 [Cucumis melo]